MLSSVIIGEGIRMYSGTRRSYGSAKQDAAKVALKAKCFSFTEVKQVVEASFVNSSPSSPSALGRMDG